MATDTDTDSASLGGALLAALTAQRQAGLDAHDRARLSLRLRDTIGNALAAGRDPTALAVLDGLGPVPGPASVWGLDRRLAPAQAAFANAALCHALDFDEVHDVARLHACTVTLPAALAAAQALAAQPGGRRVHLGQVAEAVLLGNELMCRLALLAPPDGTGPASQWFTTQLLGYFGAALAAATVMALTPEQQVTALGLAYMQAAGGKQTAFGSGSDARAFYPAFAAMGGLQAALFARAGLQGPTQALEGAAGLLPLYLGLEAHAARAALLAPAPGWRSLDSSLKPWPCCRLAQPYVSAALVLHRLLAGRPIERVLVMVNASTHKLCQPAQDRCQPRTLQDAKYSIPFLTACALVHGEVSLATLQPAVLNDAQVLALAARVEVDACLPDGPGHAPARVYVQTDRRGWLTADPRELDLDEAGARAKFIAGLRQVGRDDGAALWLRLDDLRAVTEDELHTLLAGWHLSVPLSLVA